MALDKKEKDFFRSNVSLPKGHENRFLEKLEQELPQKKTALSYYVKIAAAIVIFLGLGGIAYFVQTDFSKESIPAPSVAEGVDEQKNVSPSENEQITLGDLSPDLKKIQEYYAANINLTLASLEVNDANKRLFDGYMNRLAVLDKEYKTLTKELNTYGPNEQTVNALINNLQLRLQLLYKLKNKLEELKKTKQHESIS